jgi:hypothetical protein
LVVPQLKGASNERNVISNLNYQGGSVASAAPSDLTYFPLTSGQSTATGADPKLFTQPFGKMTTQTFKPTTTQQKLKG